MKPFKRALVFLLIAIITVSSVSASVDEATTESSDLWWYIRSAKEIEEDPLMGLPFCPGDKMYVPMGCTGERQISDYMRNVRLTHPEVLFRKVTAKSHIWLYRDTKSGLIPEKFVRLYKY